MHEFAPITPLEQFALGPEGNGVTLEQAGTIYERQDAGSQMHIQGVGMVHIWPFDQIGAYIADKVGADAAFGAEGQDDTSEKRPAGQWQEGSTLERSITIEGSRAVEALLAKAASQGRSVSRDEIKEARSSSEQERKASADLRALHDEILDD